MSRRSCHPSIPSPLKTPNRSHHDANDCSCVGIQTPSLGPMTQRLRRMTWRKWPFAPLLAASRTNVSRPPVYAHSTSDCLRIAEIRRVSVNASTSRSVGWTPGPASPSVSTAPGHLPSRLCGGELSPLFNWGLSSRSPRPPTPSRRYPPAAAGRETQRERSRSPYEPSLAVKIVGYVKQVLIVVSADRVDAT